MENSIIPSQTVSKVAINTYDKQNTPTIQQKQQSLLDFSSMFKKNGFIKKPMPKLGGDRKIQSQGPNWLLQIPAKLEITISDLQQRRYINQQKWNLMSKSDKLQDLSLASLISSLNYLSKQQLTSKVPFLKLEDIKDKFKNSNLIQTQSTRRQQILTYINFIKQEYKADWLTFKIHQFEPQIKNKDFIHYAVQAFKNKRKALIYICHGQILCPIGFQNTPLVPLDAYKRLNEIDLQKLQMWIICLCPDKNKSPFVIKRWSDIEKQMSCRWPNYLDLQNTKKGIQIFDSQTSQINCKTQEISCWIQLTYQQNQN